MKLAILDRDGVVNRDCDAFVKSPDEFAMLPGSAEAIARLNKAGFHVAVATNQSGVARGLFSRETLAAINAKMTREIEAAGGRLAYVAICPHGPGDGCSCRKPLPGLVDEVFAALGVKPGDACFMVGDSLRDLQAGAARGCRPVLVRTGKGQATLRQHRGSLPAGTEIFDDLAAFAAAMSAEPR